MPVEAARKASPWILSPLPLTGNEPCAGADVFFLDFYGATESRLATRLCRQCPVVEACFIWALVHPSLAADGIWGATTPGQRDDIRAGLVRRLGPSRLKHVLKEAYTRAVRKSDA